MPTPETDAEAIFSTHVEMNRNDSRICRTDCHFLYARGDEPQSAPGGGNNEGFSLRTWR